MASARVNATTLVEGQAGGETTANTYLARLEHFGGATVIDRDLATAPVSPTNGDTYITAGTGGAWSPFAVGSLVTYLNGWLGCTPKGGFTCFVVDEKIPLMYSSVESLWFPLTNVWSATEHWTGKYRAGAKVYAKQFTFSAVALIGFTAQAHGISGLDLTKAITCDASVINSGAQVFAGTSPTFGVAYGFVFDGTNVVLDWSGPLGFDVVVRAEYCR